MIQKSDFHKIDHSWVTKMDGSLLSIESHGGVFRLYIYGALAELPAPEPNAINPTDREWQTFLKLANDLDQIKRIAKKQQ